MRKRDLIDKRDKCMVRKFHELYDVKRRRMDDVLHELSQDYFFLDEQYIYSRIFYCEKNNALYNELLSTARKESFSRD